MKLHHLMFAGGLQQACDHLNANRLASFDVVAMRPTRRKEVEYTEVVLLVPGRFDEAEWVRDEGGYRESMLQTAREYRGSKT